MSRRVVHPGNLQCFLDVYKEELIKSHKENPDSYAWPFSELDEVFKRMSAAIERGSFNKDSKAFKSTCKALGIKHTYRDIDAYMRGIQL